MTSREVIGSIIRRENPVRNGFWLGNPHPDSLPALLAYFGVNDEEELREKLCDDFRWITPQYMETVYRHPEGKGIFDVWKHRKFHGEPGPLADCVDRSEIDRYEFPSPEFLNFEECVTALENTKEVYRASGFWMPFFHDAADLFGMEQFLLAMYMYPDLVDAVLERVCGFYLEANRRFFAAAGNRIDAIFFGNDFGTQRDTVISPDLFDRFFLPWITKIAQEAHTAGYNVLLHSCGAVAPFIERFLEAGVDALHPLQALATGMEAEELAKRFGGRVAFIGGVDTQNLLPEGTPAEIKQEVRRLKEIFGKHYIVSPSHEAILPNIPPRNVAAMAEAALE